MTFRINVNSCKNAIGTVFLLVAAFFVCSTFISMRSVFADPVAPTYTLPQKSGRASPRATTTSRATVARTATTRATVTPKTSSRSTSARNKAANRTVSSRGGASVRNVSKAPTTTRGVTARNQPASSTRANRAVRARTANTPSRVSANGTMMAGSRAGTSYSYLASSLYTGSYSNIIDSTTGLISADAYSNCLDSYYTCMDEICTARSDTKGRCSCAGRATNFLSAETSLEKANEELIKLSGQLSLLIATKGEGDDLAAAFSLTDAEKVLNCVSYQEASDKTEWCDAHPQYNSDGSLITTCKMPDYCKSANNNFGFDISNINGSGSDILAQLQEWAKAKDLAKEYTVTDNNKLLGAYTTVDGMVNAITGVTETNESDVSLDSLANKWGYDLFQYAHNNVCGRVLDSCFNGIYEACGTPKSITEGDKTVRIKCANGSTSKCPFNYNSYISVESDGEVKLSDRSNTDATVSSTAECFGYTTTTTTVTRSGTTTTSTDPYASLRGPVADARRSIMQKYLLDANAACDAYGTQLKQTAQNINYQKIAAEQALQQKRLEFKQEKEADAFANATTAINNFNECISEIWDCYDEYSDEDNWTTARIKSYCSQVAQVPHCYETMICSPLQTQLVAVVDKPDSDKCVLSNDYTETTCRNVVTISEILYGASKNNNVSDALENWSGIGSVNGINSANVRELCLQRALGCGPNAGTIGSSETPYCLRRWNKTDKGVASTSETTVDDPGLYSGYKSCSLEEIRALGGDKVVYAETALRVDGGCLITRCVESTGLVPNSYGTDCVCGSSEIWDSQNEKCVSQTKQCDGDELIDLHAEYGYKAWNYSTNSYGDCVVQQCSSNYQLTNGTCVCKGTVEAGVCVVD